MVLRRGIEFARVTFYKTCKKHLNVLFYCTGVGQSLETAFLFYVI